MTLFTYRLQCNYFNKIINKSITVNRSAWNKKDGQRISEGWKNDELIHFQESEKAGIKEFFSVLYNGFIKEKQSIKRRRKKWIRAGLSWRVRSLS